MIRPLVKTFLEDVLVTRHEVLSGRQIEVAADGTTTPGVLEGQLAVRAQGVEKMVGPGMGTLVRRGQPPQEPFSLPPPPGTLELRLSSAALLLIVTPLSTAAGLAPPGYPISQEPGAKITLPPEEPQVVLFRRVVDGTYEAFLHGIASGNYELEVVGRADNRVVCQRRIEGEIEEGEKWAVSIDVDEEEGRILECDVRDPQRVIQEPKAVLVQREHLLARLPPMPEPSDASPSPAPTSTVAADTGRVLVGDAYVNLEGPASVPPQERGGCIILRSESSIDVEAVRVEMPLGTSVILPPSTDAFWPDAEVTTPFLFADCVPVSPVPGGTYRFVAIDAASEPLPGLEATDVWLGVDPPDPPSNVNAMVTEAGLEMTWGEVAKIAGSFDPDAVPQLGFYQIDLEAEEEATSQSLYMATGIAVPAHTVPWSSADFIEGVDQGLALDELAPGSYWIRVSVHSMAPKDSAGHGFEYNNADAEQSVSFQVTAEGEVILLPQWRQALP